MYMCVFPDIFGGPFGDSPFDSVQDAYQDYLLIMFRNDDDTPGTSGASRADLDLYNVKCDYAEQLNLVRRKLNLMELSEDAPKKCTITEIVEDAPQTVEKASSCSSEKLRSVEEASKGSELTTIHPFSLNYNLESGSSTNVIEQDYSPPTKKVCQRFKTPRIASVSEGSVPYHTKVGIYDSLFQTELNAQRRKKSFVSKVAKQFTETRQTQCNEEEFKDTDLVERDVGVPQSSEERFSVLDLSFETESYSEYESPNSGSLFPKVIIETKDGQDEEESSLSSESSQKCTTTSSSVKDSIKKSSERNVLSLNSVRGSSEDEDPCTVKLMNTTIDTSDQKRRGRRKIFKRQKATLGKLTMWEEITRLRSGANHNRVGNRGEGDAARSGEPSYDISTLNSYIGKLAQDIKLGGANRESHGDGKSKLNQYIQQYVQYKTEMDKLISAKKHNKHAVIGQGLVNIQNRIMDSPEKLYQSEHSLVSDEEKQGKFTSSLGDSSDDEEKRRFWERFCFCLCPVRNFKE